MALGQLTGLSFLHYFFIFEGLGIDVGRIRLRIPGMRFNFLKQSKWPRHLLRTLGGLFLLWGLAWLLVPPIVKAQFERLATEQLGRKVTLGKVDFQPWSLELTVHDLTVARHDGAADSSPQFQIKRFYIDAELQSLVRLAPVVDAIEMEGPHLSVTHLGQGRYDVDDLLARFSKPSDKPGAAPLGFALYNLALTGGSLDFVDQSLAKTHQLQNLQIKLPFLSNLASQRTVLVQPQIAFRLNGSQFDSAAQTTPFAQSHKTDASFKLTDLDLAPYLGYLPASLPVKLKSAVLNADLKVSFEQSPKTAVRLSGTVQAEKVKIEATSDAVPLLDFDLLKMTLADVRPLERVVHLGALEWRGPQVSLKRSKSGKLNLATLLNPEVATKSIALEGRRSAPEAQNGQTAAAWDLSVAKIAVRRGALLWTDNSIAPTARVELGDIVLDAAGIALPFVQPLQFEGAAKLSSKPGSQSEIADSIPSLRFQGRATDLAAEVTATVADLPLSVAGPYLSQFMTPLLNGTLNAELGVTWRASADGKKPAELQFNARQLTLDDVALSQGKTSLVSIKQLQVAQAQIDLARQTARLGALTVRTPKVALGRDADGHWMFESWLKGTSATPLKTAMPRPKARKTTAPGWQVVIQDLELVSGALAFADHSLAKPVAFDLMALSVQLKNFSNAATRPFSAHVSTQIRAGRAEAGRLAWRGGVGLSPVALQGRVDAVRMPVHVFEPYLADVLNIELLRAEASFKGDVSYVQSVAGPTLKVNGDTSIEEFQANTVPVRQANVSGAHAVVPTSALTIGEELLSWKLLNVRGLELAVAPGTATRVSVQETVLSDFFARLILDATGRLNLQDLAKSPMPATSSLATPLVAASSAAKNLVPEDATMAAKPLKDPGTELAAVINIGPVTLVGGRVHFSDRFIQPNYSANLTELTGKLSAFSSVSDPGGVNLADLELRGRAEGTASLEIMGKVNPLATPLALDIKGRVRDLELPALSPYSVRHTGHGIERGKLSVDVGYLVLPNGQLTASNNIVLNQLSFGEQVEGAPASLPVKLAVALLADRHGVIDINLPVSGSLNDPQFKLAPIVFKLILNLIAKAITSPFSLLASAFGGGADELSQVSFAPGSAVLAPDAQLGLAKVATALLDRPALKMTVVGTASLAFEREAFKREQLKALVQAESRRANVVAGAPVTAVALEQEGASAVEYPALLKAVYRRADFPKPRNLLGMTKDLTVSEMEALLLAHLTVTDDAMRELALQRGMAVRDYLAAQNLPTERLFLGAAKALPSDAKWSPRAELNLTTQ